jgi:hypothetical protein
MTASWHFRGKRPSDTARDPISSEFFADESVENAARALIREAIQNSLDARVTRSAPVEIRIQLAVGGNGARASEVAQFFDGTWKHLRAKSSGLQVPPDPSERCAFITVEDFGTSGLEGDPLEWTPRENSNNAFYAFFRAEAYSEKAGDDRGRWGVGKLVFPRSSRASAFFGFTVPRSSAKPMFMGRIILRHHRVEGVEYVPDAFFGEARTVDGDEAFVAPCSDRAMIKTFCAAFGVTRTDQPGLSVVVPWLADDDDFTSDALIRAVTAEYLLPILREELVVTISSRDTAQRLDRAALLNEDAAWADDDLRPLLRLGGFAAGARSQFVLATASADTSSAPKWPDTPLASDDVRNSRASLERNEPLAVDVPIRVYLKNGSNSLSRLRVHLLATGNSNSVAPVFVREGITISTAKGLRVPGYLALVTIDDSSLATLLGDAENPAHTEWRQNTRGFKEKYRFGKAYLDFVRNAPMALFRTLFEGDRDDDLFSLGAFFPDVSTEADRGGGVTRKQSPSGGGGVKVPPITRQPRSYSLVRIHGGFEVRPGDLAARRPGQLRIVAAYDVRRGNPLRQYEPFDFDFADRTMAVAAVGAEMERAEENELLVRVTADEFKISVTGFDVNRDVYVRVTSEESDEH